MALIISTFVFSNACQSSTWGTLSYAFLRSTNVANVPTVDLLPIYSQLLEYIGEKSWSIVDLPARKPAYSSASFSWYSTSVRFFRTFPYTLLTDLVTFFWIISFACFVFLFSYFCSYYDLLSCSCMYALFYVFTVLTDVIKIYCHQFIV